MLKFNQMRVPLEIGLREGLSEAARTMYAERFPLSGLFKQREPTSDSDCSSWLEW